VDLVWRGHSVHLADCKLKMRSSGIAARGLICASVCMLMVCGFAFQLFLQQSLKNGMDPEVLFLAYVDAFVHASVMGLF
jgi:hypothetical protein